MTILHMAIDLNDIDMVDMILTTATSLEINK